MMPLTTLLQLQCVLKMYINMELLKANSTVQQSITNGIAVNLCIEPKTNMNGKESRAHVRSQWFVSKHFVLFFHYIYHTHKQLKG